MAEAQESSIQSLLLRAKRAIAEAKRISTAQYQPALASAPSNHAESLSTLEAEATQGNASQGPPDLHGSSTAPAQPCCTVEQSASHHVGEQERNSNASSDTEGQVSAPGATLTMDRQVTQLLSVARRLATLQEQQANTLQQLLTLRLQQLKLRQQQLGALRGLLVTELQNNPHQDRFADTAVSQALALLTESLKDVSHTVKVLEEGNIRVTLRVITTVTEADSRAEDVSGIARHLLTLLRRQAAARTSGPSGPVGATDQQLESLPVSVCSSAQANDSNDEREGEHLCPICLGPFCVGEELCSAGCGHDHHKRCLWEWLRLSACCPICKRSLAATAGSGGGEDTAEAVSETDGEETGDGSLPALSEVGATAPARASEGPLHAEASISPTCDALGSCHVGVGLDVEGDGASLHTAADGLHHLRAPNSQGTHADETCQSAEDTPPA